MENLSVMIVGMGAREHTISNAYEKSDSVKRIIVTPGNDFIGFNRGKEVIIDKSCSLKDKMSILAIANKYKPNLIDVAQDDALASGLVDSLRYNGFRVFGPTQAESRLEWDKKWSRDLMVESGIWVPEFKAFKVDDLDSVERYLTKMGDKVLYVKATGLYAGKGALKSNNVAQALENVQKIKKFNNIDGWFLIEEGLGGEEFSYYVITDGKNYHAFKSAQDNKTVFNFDEGDQTGGMGAISPAFVTKGIEKKIEEEQISRIIRGLQEKGINYEGVIYLGGIINEKGIFNIEYNARWGDPECQAVLPALETDYVDVVNKSIDGELGDLKIQQDNLTRVCVVGASRGYPNGHDAVKGKQIFGLEQAMKIPGVNIFSAGIDVEDGKFYANGGRLFSVVGEGENIIEARGKVYRAISMINIKDNNLHYRTDIGWRDAERFLS